MIIDDVYLISSNLHRLSEVLLELLLTELIWADQRFHQTVQELFGYGALVDECK